MINVSKADAIELTEYEYRQLPSSALSSRVGEALYHQYKAQVDVEPPSFKNDNQWGLTAQGWIGAIPLPDGQVLRLKPKVRLHNLFRMLEYAYQFDVKFLEGTIEADSLEEYYERLANILARRILDRTRRGLYRTYLEREERLPYVRGRLHAARTAKTPWKINPLCQFEENTADVEDNQILAWTMFSVARSGMCSERVLPTVRRAYRGLLGMVSPHEHSGSACVGRAYSRLNLDYKPLHALCRFFLDHTGPSHQVGDRTMIPFLVDMAALFEKFVAEWLKTHLPDRCRLRTQYPVTLHAEHSHKYFIDLVVEDRETERPLFVMDTKYKAVDEPAADDTQQILAYALSTTCPTAVLIYPRALANPFDHVVQDRIRLRTLVFDIGGDLEDSGQRFLEELFVQRGDHEHDDFSYS